MSIEWSLNSEGMLSIQSSQSKFTFALKYWQDHGEKCATNCTKKKVDSFKDYIIDAFNRRLTKIKYLNFSSSGNDGPLSFQITPDGTFSIESGNMYSDSTMQFTVLNSENKDKLLEILDVIHDSFVKNKLQLETI